MRRFFSSLIFSSVLLSFSACHHKTNEIVLKHTLPLGCDYYSLKSAQCQGLEQMPSKLEPYKVIFIGDHHTQPNLHKDVAKLIMELAKNGTKVHLANEWFYPRDEKVLNAYTTNEINETEFIEQIQWEKRLKYYPYTSFQPMYQAIKKTQGKLHGINLTKKEQKKISDQNLSAMTQDERIFNASLDLNISAHKGMVLPFLSHCHAPKTGESLQECSQRMYRVQVAWDTKMANEAYNLSLKLQQNEKLIVFAGAMHMENSLGIPLHFARLSNQPTVNITPADTADRELEHGTSDYVLLYSDTQAKE